MRACDLPHVPGHEFAGVVEQVGADVTRFRQGDRVTAPFVYACGHCAQCLEGDQQVCANQEQPGFTLWGSFAELVVVLEADIDLVALPEASAMPRRRHWDAGWPPRIARVVSRAAVEGREVGDVRPDLDDLTDELVADDERGLDRLGGPRVPRIPRGGRCRRCRSCGPGSGCR